MSRTTLVQDLGEWLIDQALAEPDIVELFNQLCNHLYAIGVPVGRARLTWPTLHPLFQAETILWKRGEEIEFEQFKHQDEVSEEWQRSPMAFMFDNGLSEFRRNLDGPNKQIDFPILEDLVQQGLTDYLVIATRFITERKDDTISRRGIFVNWACDREGGFSDDDIGALHKIQRRFATAVKSVVQNRIATNITETYLGRHAGSQVLDGAIKLGDGRETDAVVWYCDMRESTSLADTMPPEEFLELLNDYFECTAGAAIEIGGEVLDFIGDAVLAIFPFEDETGKKQAISCATIAMEQALERTEKMNASRKAEGKLPFKFGVGINSGRVMFGNIGVATRLAFSVIGPTVNEAERIEELTKAHSTWAITTKEIANENPQFWSPIGSHRLKGVAGKTELFGFVPTGDSEHIPAELKETGSSLQLN